MTNHEPKLSLNESLWVILIQDGTPNLYGPYWHLPHMVRDLANFLKEPKLRELQIDETYRNPEWSVTIIKHDRLTDRIPICPEI